MKVKIYVEGGGDSRSLHIKCREGFRKLLERAGFVRRMPAIKACGSRNDAFDDFRTAVESAGVEDYPVLLVDSESAVASDAWDHLKQRDGWDRPEEADADQAHLMVQCMETWCLADRKALAAFYGQGFTRTALLADVDLEARSKEDVQQAVENATRACGEARRYRKGRRSFELLGRLDPAALTQRLPHFGALCHFLQSKL